MEIFFSSLDIDALVGGEVGGLEFGKLPFGACEDPIRCDFHYMIWIMGLLKFYLMLILLCFIILQPPGMNVVLEIETYM